MTEPKYIIGIDLGTTNSVAAYTRASTEPGQSPVIEDFHIPQIVAPGTVEVRPLLPSFILLPGSHDVAKGALDLPWISDNPVGIGSFARDRGGELPSRLISSSKSWLCHPLVDRNKPILPWDCPEEEVKKSPVEASSAILDHIRRAWNHEMATGEDGEPDETLLMENQEILLTVPASFDAVARELTVTAAKMAGLSNITLLEEPQAAFYSWIEVNGDKWREQVGVGDLALVCDVGGGTTDFSLIRVTEKDGSLGLERIAVGDHLLVGGDNMDLALAYRVAGDLKEKGKKLDSWQMRGLWHNCRSAKEKLLSDSQLKEQVLSILGRGSSLIGGTIRTELALDTVLEAIVEGFFPVCEKTDRPRAVPQAGIREVGLSYEADPAITRHLAKFLARGEGGEPLTPVTVLFNGGVMKSDPVRRRVMDVLSSWRSDDAQIREMQTRDFDLSVARGAAYFGLARRGRGVRIRGGLSRSYYIGIAASLPAVPGMPIPVRACCVGPFGMEEGTQEMLSDREFVLVVGEPVKFDFLGSTIRTDDEVGTVVDDWEEEIQKITTIETTLDGDIGSSVPVRIMVKVTEIGTLELWCVSTRDTEQKWKLEFNVREVDALES